MRQAKTETQEFSRELKRHTQDVDMVKEDAKIHLVSALN